MWAESGGMGLGTRFRWTMACRLPAEPAGQLPAAHKGLSKQRSLAVSLPPKVIPFCCRASAALACEFAGSHAEQYLRCNESSIMLFMRRVGLSKGICRASEPFGWQCQFLVQTNARPDTPSMPCLTGRVCCCRHLLRMTRTSWSRLSVARRPPPFSASTARSGATHLPPTMVNRCLCVPVLICT